MLQVAQLGHQHSSCIITATPSILVVIKPLVVRLVMLQVAPLERQYSYCNITAVYMTP